MWKCLLLVVTALAILPATLPATPDVSTGHADDPPTPAGQTGHIESAASSKPARVSLVKKHGLLVPAAFSSGVVALVLALIARSSGARDRHDDVQRSSHTCG
jgi:hypothetical protein